MGDQRRPTIGAGVVDRPAISSQWGMPWSPAPASARSARVAAAVVGYATVVMLW
ncbi:hypothetical protein I545_3614 [Mycobacterium kansasii 662]|uniref:Uncharacterized protein n=2 Tax=Mycobacterium kansasii TaxID=1768 RepID=A0A1V3XEF9_MYCKA|nr:hypothetical protein I547_5626 [Mycobacterium kansasii 824]EUA16792.1 hypothetical protein I545_3614 [Mycobacterium kansasii 662]KEP41624.1 hypothetical protein MKSMC1_32440 [Mycobacterium kansasii]OOK77136.1 hypothetical protein BZL29_3893 [Mycobacterium kansasii]